MRTNTPSHRQILCTMVQAMPPRNTEEHNNLIQATLNTAMYSLCCISHGSLQNVSPGTVAFNRDMFLDLPFIADLLTIQAACQAQIDKRLLQANAKRISKDWKLQDRVLIRNAICAGDKLKPTFSGPFEIIIVHTNGNVTVCHPNGVQERVNIRCLKPFKE